VASGAPVDASGVVTYRTFARRIPPQSFATVPRGPRGHVPMRMRQSISQFEVAFEQETTLERRRREQLRRRAANRSRARRISRSEQESKVRFSVLAVCLTVTVVVVVVAMFEALAFLMA
jgi:hypothetical protein